MNKIQKSLLYMLFAGVLLGVAITSLFFVTNFVQYTSNEPSFRIIVSFSNDTTKPSPFSAESYNQFTYVDGLGNGCKYLAQDGNEFEYCISRGLNESYLLSLNTGVEK